MFFKRSTRAIVTGNRPKIHKETDIDNNLKATNQPENNAGTTINSNKKTTYNWKNIKDSVWRILWSPVAVILLLIAAFLLVITVIVMDPRGSAPVLAEDQVVIAVDATPALSNQVDQGDVVRLYTNDGLPIPELQYVQVYQPSTGNGLLLLADERQAAVLVSREISQKIVLVVHDDPVRASALLDLQSRINDPTISLTLQKPSPIAPGDTLEVNYQLSADPSEAIMPQIEWDSSDPAVATVENGIITAHKVGKTTISVSCGNARATCTVSVEILLEEIKLSQSECSLYINSSTKITAVAEPSDTTAFDVDWSTADPTVATISDDGTVTGISPGTTIATASCGSITTECVVNVGVPAEMVQLDKSSLSLAIGQSDVLSALIYPNENVIDVGVFESSNPSVATVSADGIVSAVSSGTAIITYRCGQAEAGCYITVEAPE